jgi:hypothetical protein
VDDRRIFDRSQPTYEAAVEKIAQEFRDGFAAVARIDRPAVSMFGSARVGDDHPRTRRRARSAAASPGPAGRSSPAAGRE